MQLTYPPTADNQVREILRNLNLHPMSRIPTPGIINVTDTEDACNILIPLKLRGIFNAATPAPDPVPFTITGLSPSTVANGSPSFNLTVTGIGFLSGDTVVWNGVSYPKLSYTNTQIVANIDKNLVKPPTAGTTVLVQIRHSGGQLSNSLPFTIT